MKYDINLKEGCVPIVQKASLLGDYTDGRSCREFHLPCGLFKVGVSYGCGSKEEEH